MLGKSEKMRILHINNLASVSYNLCKGLNELEQNAELFYKPSKFIENREEKWIHTPKNRLESYSHNFINFDRYDIIHIHHPISINPATARLKCLFHNQPCVIHFHGSITSNYNNLTIPQKIVQRISTYKPALILYSTPNIYENIKNMFKNIKKVYLPNPVVIPNIKIKKTYENRVLIFTEMYKFKGLEKWIPIIKKLPHIQFDIIDKGQDRDYFRGILPDNINYIREVPHSEIYSLLSKYPLVLGQRNKVMSVAELESMSLGIPTLFDWNSNEFYDEPLPMPSNLNEKTILEILGDFDFGDMQKEWVEKNHDYRNVAKRLLKLYEEVWG